MYETVSQMNDPQGVPSTVSSLEVGTSLTASTDACHILFNARPATYGFLDLLGSIRTLFRLPVQAVHPRRSVCMRCRSLHADPNPATSTIGSSLIPIYRTKRPSSRGSSSRPNPTVSTCRAQDTR
ncbi:hypothetical protein BD310DRAFT_131815 [Dichomitus squalens]|uniref:Uncharacterized protein n=1 Tax=Dichomitus squalens TaxID=114155 RepID=A0A4V2K6V7_9APHY|nr:hypothetical protein BD310DRAFT_131815 [Dichomitus squalens]